MSLFHSICKASTGFSQKNFKIVTGSRPLYDKPSSLRQSVDIDAVGEEFVKETPKKQ